MSEQQVLEPAATEQGQLVMPFYLTCDVSCSMRGDMLALNDGGFFITDSEPHDSDWRTVGAVTYKRLNGQGAGTPLPESHGVNVDQSFKDLLEASSLGTPAARRIRSSTPSEVVDDVRLRMEHRRERSLSHAAAARDRLAALRRHQAALRAQIEDETALGAHQHYRLNYRFGTALAVALALLDALPVYLGAQASGLGQTSTIILTILLSAALGGTMWLLDLFHRQGRRSVLRILEGALGAGFVAMFVLRLDYLNVTGGAGIWPAAIEALALTAISAALVAVGFVVLSHRTPRALASAERLAWQAARSRAAEVAADPAQARQPGRGHHLHGKVVSQAKTVSAMSLANVTIGRSGSEEHWQPALTPKEVAMLGISKDEYEWALIYARMAVEEHQRLGTRRDLWELTSLQNDHLADPFIADGERELVSRLEVEADPALDMAQVLIENVKANLDKIAQDTPLIVAEESGASYSVAAAVERGEQDDMKIEQDKAVGKHHHHHRVGALLRRLAGWVPWVEAAGFLTFVGYYLNVPLLHPWQDWLGWSFAVTVVVVIIVGQTWLVRHAARNHNHAREARAGGNRHEAHQGSTRRGWYIGLTAVTAVAITSGMIWRGIAALGNASIGTTAVMVFVAAVTGLLLPILAYLGLALDGSTVSRKGDSLAADLDDELDAYLETISNSRRDLAGVAQLGDTLKDETFPAICHATQEAVDAVYGLYGTVRFLIGGLSAEPPHQTTETIAQDAKGNIRGYIGTSIPGTRKVNLDPLFDRWHRLAEIETQRTSLLDRIDALPPLPWGQARPDRPHDDAMIPGTQTAANSPASTTGGDSALSPEPITSPGMRTPRTRVHRGAPSRRRRPAPARARATARNQQPRRSRTNTRHRDPYRRRPVSRYNSGRSLTTAMVVGAVAVVITAVVGVLAGGGFGGVARDLAGRTSPSPAGLAGSVADQVIYTARTANDAAIFLPGVVQEDLLQAGLAHRSVTLTRVGYTGDVFTSYIDMTPRTGNSSTDPPLRVAGREIAAVKAKISGIQTAVNSTAGITGGGRALLAGLTRTTFSGASVIIVSSGLDLANPDNFRALNWSVPPAEVVAAVQQAGDLPALHDPVTFVLVPTAGLQPQLGQARKDYIKAVWAALLKAAGATSVTFINATGTSASSAAP